MPTYSASIYLRKQRVNRSGESPLYLIVIINKVRLQINIQETLPAKCWNTQRQMVVKAGEITQERVDKLNELIESELFKAKRIFNDFRIKERPLNIDSFQQAYLQGDTDQCFHTWVNKQIDELVGIRGKRTIDHYRVTFRRLKEFRPKLHFYDLTHELPVQFDNWLIKTCGLDKLNTRAKYHKHFKTFTRMLGRQEDVTVPNVYEHFRIRQVRSKRTFLTKTEVATLVQLHQDKTLSPHIQKALQRFLFSCHCGGLRCADLNRVSWNDFEDGYLCFYPEKTQHIDKLIEVPLTKAAIRFVQHPNGRMFDQLSNQKYNEYLKIVQRIAGIKKTLTTHVARHTFATNYLVAGGRREVLQRILGHADPETTEVYVHTTRQHITDELHILGQMY